MTRVELPSCRCAAAFFRPLPQVGDLGPTSMTSCATSPFSPNSRSAARRLCVRLLGPLLPPHNFVEALRSEPFLGEESLGEPFEKRRELAVQRVLLVRELHRLVVAVPLARASHERSLRASLEALDLLVLVHQVGVEYVEQELRHALDDVAVVRASLSVKRAAPRGSRARRERSWRKSRNSTSPAFASLSRPRT